MITLNKLKEQPYKYWEDFLNQGKAKSDVDVRRIKRYLNYLGKRNQQTAERWSNSNLWDKATRKLIDLGHARAVYDRGSLINYEYNVPEVLVTMAVIGVPPKKGTSRNPKKLREIFQ